MDAWIGRTLLNRYRVTERLASGGMAAVCLAADENLGGRRVVVKHPLREHDRAGSGLTDGDLRRHLEREVRGLIALESIAGVVPILAQGVHEGTPFYVMRWMAGGSLEQRLAPGPQGPVDVLAWARPVARALDRLHARQPAVVHRDVKPANLLFDEEGAAHLSDVGIVKELNAAWATTGPAGAPVGRPRNAGARKGSGTPRGRGGRDGGRALLPLTWLTLLVLLGGAAYLGRALLDRSEPGLPLPSVEPAAGPRPGPAPAPPWAKVSEEQVAEAARWKVPVAYEEETTGIRFVLIPGGTFRMGSDESDASGLPGERPPRRVTLPPYYLSVHEVTNEQYRRRNAGRRGTRDGGTHPVTGVDWNEATAYAAWLDGRGTPKGYALPTEAQWEHACRAGTTTRWSFGDDEARLEEHAWFEGNSGSTTHPVGGKAPNRWGLHDMHGNVWEWCADDAHATYAGAPTDGRAWVDSPRAAQRVLRGGSWFVFARFVRSATRYRVEPTYRNDYLGFRLARAVTAR